MRAIPSARAKITERLSFGRSNEQRQRAPLCANPNRAAEFNQERRRILRSFITSDLTVALAAVDCLWVNRCPFA
jgi:hypothetical protein